MLYGWKENSMLTNCLAACADLTITVSEIQRDICEKNRHFIIPLAFDAPVRGVPSEYRHPFWDGKTRMVSLPDGEKCRRYVYSFWRDPRTWHTDGQTDRQTLHDSKDRAYASHRAVKTSFFNKINDIMCFDIIKKIFNGRSNKVFISYIFKINTFNQNVLHC